LIATLRHTVESVNKAASDIGIAERELCPCNTPRARGVRAGSWGLP
jgi:hypothetical protein